MQRNNFTIILFLMISCFGCAQTTMLCSLNESIFIEDSSNIPTVTDNGDGTITLLHKEQYITDIFAKYVIYEFTKVTSSTYNINVKLKI